MKKLLWGLALAALAVAHLTCSQALLTAVPGSTLSLFANPEFIAANGDVSAISALIVEPNGTVVPDGTVVQFFTNLGRIDAQGKTSDGIAHVNLVSDSRSGDAEVTAISGGGAPAPAPSASPIAAASVEDAIAIAAASSGTNAASITVHIGSGRPASVQVTANPPRITGLGPARQSQLVANVFDDNGNQVSNVPVIFTITEDSSQTETLQSGSSPIYTDSNGQAVDHLQTRYDAEADPKVVTVTATTSNGKTGTVQVQIN
jgi:hypothetical protein